MKQLDLLQQQRPLAGISSRSPPATPPLPDSPPPPKQSSLVACTHAGAAPGLDACYCPDCRRSIARGTAEYNELMKKEEL
ncbi:MAG: hypothetical protein HC833_10825 [Leptolyngbyaceae cyanobacterium RM1_406_9]|nr:hypothetical protein [Leptolyngbyaceae cyanobacterium RM1_406_9]